MATRRVALGLAAWLATPVLTSAPHKARPNLYADFSIGAAKLLDTKAAALLRHAKARLHLHAVASLLDVPCGAQVNTTSSVTTSALTRVRGSVWRARAPGALGGRFLVEHAR